MATLKSRLVLTSAVVVLTALVLLARPLPTAEKAGGKNHVVQIEGMLFKPATLEIAPGDTVTWINDDIFLHAIKSNEPGHPWQSPDLKPHDSWTKFFPAGSAYLCPYHPTMTGKVVVQEKAKSSAAP